jgi:hypothetical protein
MRDRMLTIFIQSAASLAQAWLGLAILNCRNSERQVNHAPDYGLIQITSNSGIRRQPVDRG